MELYERLWNIFLESMNRWVEDTPEDKLSNEKQVLSELLEYMQNIERWYKDNE